MRIDKTNPAQPALGLLPTNPASLHIRTGAHALMAAASSLLSCLERGDPLDATTLRRAMTNAFGKSDTEGAWAWKDAYEASEAALILFLRKYLPAMRGQAAEPAALLPMLANITNLLPSHTKRSEESQQFQQFSTPVDLAYAASLAAAITDQDAVLEPSAGTGQLAIFAETLRARLTLNELAVTRANLLAALFPKAALSRFNAEQIHDYLPRTISPSVILMNPPFSAQAHVNGSVTGIDLRHVRAALLRLVPGGRLVAITSASAEPSNAAYKSAFDEISRHGRIVFSAPLSGKFFQRYGTTIETRLAVIDKTDAPQPINPTAFYSQQDSADALIRLIKDCVPPRLPFAFPSSSSASEPQLSLFSVRLPTADAALASPPPSQPFAPPPELAYDTINAAEALSAPCTETLYEPYRLETIRIPGAKPHPSVLVQSAAMASVRLPKPTYRPTLPARVVEQGLLSDAQLESVIYAGEAHARHLAGRWHVNETYDVLSLAQDDDPSAVSFRRGWFLGDGTGAGKGRQVAGIILDNWLKGRRRAVWISKSDKLLEDAQRDWKALGRERLQIVPQDRFKIGKPITLSEGILFTTYATLRSVERNGTASRVAQIIEWLGRDFDGVIVFDEAHAMANAAGGKSARGDKAPSQQGLAGLRLQHALADARVVYVSATGATVIENLAYAQRLGYWGGDDFPFATRQEFVTAMHKGGIAATEVLARDSKALGLYSARSLSYEGVEVEILEHALTPEQIAIYDAYAGAFQIIHQNLTDALDAANVTGEGKTLNRNAKAAARSAFEQNKQRFFNHLITAMKMPTVIRSIEADLHAGHAPVVQLVSTSEALMERRLATIPASEWGDLSVDITPREYVLDYLANGFPTQLYETYMDENGKLLSRPVIIDGQPVHSREAEDARDQMIEHLAALPAVQSALDQLIQHFGTETVAEVTGRSRRIVRASQNGMPVYKLETRPPSASIGEAQAFMDDIKKVLVFSKAGGTGRSYHADLAAKNQRKRIHYLIEPGWQADEAIQGLGRTNRTNQAQPPLFRPVTTDVRGEKRFLSTIARRLDSLGAITRGQRQTGGQGLFRPEDNLESPYARTALLQLYTKLYQGHVACCSLEKFEDVTALRIRNTEDGTMLEELPPISTFLNRLLALEIALQNALFEEFETLLAAIVEGAIAGGTYEVGLETIQAESLKILTRRIVAEHSATGAKTLLFEVERLDRNEPITTQQALGMLENRLEAIPLFNRQSGHAAIQTRASAYTDEDGKVHPRFYLLRPTSRSLFTLTELTHTQWGEIDPETFAELWEKEVAAVPAFTTRTFHIATGLLLPIWKRLPERNARIYRFQTDDGERVIGRLIPPEALQALGIEHTITSASDAWALLERGVALHLAEGMTLRKAMVMHAQRYELAGFSSSVLPLLKSFGLTSEIISWKTRLFLPTGDQGPAILARLLARYPLSAQSQSAAA
ncbi:MAG: bifunctional class I SAM-dependent methyltransferase/DEAD/DEAH box helicase [Hyphomicrobium sp.]|jgi:predicted RNA methylase